MGLLDAVVLISPDGMLGRAWAEFLTARGIAWRGLVYPEFDMTVREQVAGSIPSGSTLVINCAAWTNVDGAETREAEATAVNGTAVGLLAERCSEAGACLVHYGTDYVFDGRADSPYRIDQPRAPCNAYGRSKALGEELVVASGCEHLLVRTSWLYAGWGDNFVRTISRLARERPSLRVVNDQRGRPTSAVHLAATTLRMLQAGVRRIRRITDGGDCTWYEFAAEIARHANPACLVEPCSSAEFPRPARRPGYSVLDLSATEAVLGPMPDWRLNLAAVLAEPAG